MPVVSLKQGLRRAAVAAVLAAAVAFAAPTTPASKPSEKIIRETVAVLTSQGAAALAAEDQQASLDAFLDAYQLIRADRKIPQNDPLRVRTMHGLAVAYFKAGRVDKAGEVFKSGDVLDKALAAPTASTPRSLVINRAVVDMTQKFNLMRAVKTMKDYMAATPDEVDEVLLNMFGTALATAADDERFSKTSLFQQSVKFYEQQSAKLEQAHPGKKRWGVEWVSGGEYEKLNSDRQDKVDAYNRAAKELADARRDYRQAEAWVRQEAAKRKMGRANSLGSAQNRLADVDARVGRCEREASAARGEIPKYPWLASVELVLPESAPVAVAVAPPSPPVPSPPKPKPKHTGPKPAEPVDTATVDTAPVDTAPAAPQPPPPVARAGRVTRYGTAFPVAPDLLITSAAAVQRAESVSLEDAQGNTFDASVVRADDKTGLALLRVPGRKFAFLNLAGGFAGNEAVRCTSFPTPAIFQPHAEVLTGRSAALKADAPSWTISLSANPRLGGAPIVNKADELIGVAMASRETAASSVPSVRLEDLKSFLAADVPAARCANPDPSYVMMVTAVVSK